MQEVVLPSLGGPSGIYGGARRKDSGNAGEMLTGVARAAASCASSALIRSLASVKVFGLGGNVGLIGVAFIGIDYPFGSAAGIRGLSGIRS